MRILLVEDDPEMSSMLHQVLVSAGFIVDLAMDGDTGLRKALSRNYRAIVLDLMLPRVDGLRVCAELRKQRRAAPVLMVTARDSVSDRVRGLEIGADDYLPKPFDVRELLARIRALIRRDQALKTKNLRIGELTIDTRQRVATTRGADLRLTRLEYEILEILAGQVGRVVQREMLLEVVWQDQEPGSNKVEVAIRSLRRKLDASGMPHLIETVYGMGYRIPDPEMRSAQ